MLNRLDVAIDRASAYLGRQTMVTEYFRPNMKVVLRDAGNEILQSAGGSRYRDLGITMDFAEKKGYVPNVQVTYMDDAGHNLDQKEAFRVLSHKFHGKKPGKKKVEKRMKKLDEERLMLQMSSTDTPLNTVQTMKSKQEKQKTPYITLSGSGAGSSLVK